MQEKEKNVCCESTKTTVEDDLLWKNIRIEELRQELKQKDDELDRERKRNSVLIDCLSRENSDKNSAFKEIEYAYRRVDMYRKAIDEISQICHRVLKVDDNEAVVITAKQLAKEIFDICYKF